MEIKRTMFRVCKDKNNPYVMLNKKFLNDTLLSWKAKGILAYLLSLPDDWQIYEDEIVKHSTDGKDSLRSGIKELIDKGYIIRERIRDAKGRLKGYEYSVYEVPIHIGKSKNGFSDFGFSDTTNNNLTNIYLTNNEDNEKGAFAIAESTAPFSAKYSDKEIIEAISFYMSIYAKVFSKEHPYLKSKQFKRVYEELKNFADDYDISLNTWKEMIEHHFERNMNTDYNINHFATEGVLLNIMYEIAY